MPGRIRGAVAYLLILLVFMRFRPCHTTSRRYCEGEENASLIRWKTRELARTDKPTPSTIGSHRPMRGFPK